MEIEGKLIEIMPKETGVSKAGKEWQRQCWVIETFDQYPRRVCFRVFGEERINRFAGLQLGKNYSISIDIESRDWTNPNTGVRSWFTDVSAYGWRELADQQFGPAPQPMQQPVQQPMAAQQPMQQPPFGTPAPQAPVADNGSDDLPF